MPLINCPDCGKEISDIAPACPNCGRPIKKTPQPTTIIKGQKEGCFLQTLNAGCMFIFTIIGLLVLLMVCL